MHNMIEFIQHSFIIIARHKTLIHANMFMTYNAKSKLTKKKNIEKQHIRALV